MDKQFALQFCNGCDGAGKIESKYHGNPVNLSKTYGGSDEFPVFAERAHSPSTCRNCNGFVFAKKGGYPYKSQKIADSMNKQGKAAKCHHCDNDGLSWIVPAVVKCGACNGTGFQLAYDRESTIIPDIIDIYRHQPLEFTQEWAKDVEIVVSRAIGEMTWGQAMLGIGSIWSCKDYGRLWDSKHEDIIKVIREELIDNSYQLISICDKASRKIARVVEVRVHRNGYSVVALGKEYNDYALPPAYRSIIDEPVSVVNHQLGVSE